MKALLVVMLNLPLAAASQTFSSYMAKGAEHYLRLEWEQAEAQYRAALQKRPSDADARYNLANALMQQKKYKAAIETYEGIATDKLELKAAAQYNTGVSYGKQKDLPASIEAYKAALRINPADKEARENLQKALSEAKQQQAQQRQDQNKGGGMSQNEADKKLKELQQKEKDLKQKMQQGNGRGTGGGKDW